MKAADKKQPNSKKILFVDQKLQFANLSMEGEKISVSLHRNNQQSLPINLNLSLTLTF